MIKLDPLIPDGLIDKWWIFTEFENRRSVDMAFVNEHQRCGRWRIMKALRSLIMSRLSGLAEGSELRRWEYALWGVRWRRDWAVFITCRSLIMLSAWTPPPLHLARFLSDLLLLIFAKTLLPPSFLHSILILRFPRGRFSRLLEATNNSGPIPQRLIVGSRNYQ